MYTTLFTAALFSAAALQGALAQQEYTSVFSVNQPELVVGSSAKISWQPTEGPYNILIVPVDDPCNEVLADLGDHDKTFYEWQNIDLKPGAKVLISIEDKNGGEGWSKEIEVKPAAAAPSSASSSVAASSSQGVSTVIDGTTLVVTPTGGSTPASSSSSASASASASIVAVGAAGNGIINSGSAPNGALSTAIVSIPALALAALGAVLVL